MTTTCENDTKTCGHISTFFRVDVARVIYRNLGQGKWLPKLISPYTCSRILFVVVTKWHDYSLEEKKVSADHFVNRPHVYGAVTQVYWATAMGLLSCYCMYKQLAFGNVECFCGFFCHVRLPCLLNCSWMFMTQKYVEFFG